MARSQPRLRDLYPRITAFSTLLAAFRKASKGKRYRPDVLAFGSNLEGELFRLQHELQSFTYVPGPYHQFTIREPKPRLVSAAPFRDRVVHHALMAVIGPPLERHFISTSYANRKGYGTHRALHRFHRACREHTWVLQADIRLYFPSIDHSALLAQLEEGIACPGTLWLLGVILANGGSVGLPIGNLTSQFLANLHLNALDHCLSALPGVRSYLRYVDDLALFADHPEPLQRARSRLEEELGALRLRAHPVKTQIRRCRHGASFVGFVVRPGRLRVRNHNLRRGRRRLRLQHSAVVAGTLSSAAARTSLLSWNAHLAHGHTWRLRRRLFAGLPYAAGLP